MPRHLSSILLAAGLAAGLAACAEGDSAARAAAPSEAEQAIIAPTQAELEAQAAQSITAENADQELARLKAELENP